MDAGDFYHRGRSGLPPLNTPPGVRRPCFTSSGTPQFSTPDYGQHIPALALEQKLDFLLQQFAEHKDFVTESIKKNTTELERVKEDVQRLNEKIESQSASSQSSRSSKKLPKELSV